MEQKLLEGIQAWVFDAYGTLFDFASAAARCRSDIGDHLDALNTLWRAKQLQYTWLRGLQGRHADFWTVTGDALDFSLQTLGIANLPLRDRLMNLYLTLDPFPDAVETLTHLKQAGFKTAILSNGTPGMLRQVAVSTKVGPLLDAVLSVEEVGVYKPHPKVYQLAVDRLGVPAAALAFVSANAWDAYAAQAFGMRAVWCNRQGQPPERLPGQPARVVQSLAELPALVGAR